MKISKIKIKNFKRFTDLTIEEIPPAAKLVIVVGPNGCGKSSLFDAFNHHYRARCGWGFSGDEKYYRKSTEEHFDPHSSISIEFHDYFGEGNQPRNMMYFRTAYRNEPDFNITTLQKFSAPQDSPQIGRLIDNDQTVAQNYQRLLYKTITGVYSDTNDSRAVKELREELIGKIRSSMINVFGDLILNNIADPLGDGSFLFKKGLVNSYHYKNLSGGEKSAFDLLLDLIVKIDSYDNSIFCIDEPETHMHTSLQGKLIEEVYKIIPDGSQIWVTTHSLGILRKAKELSIINPEMVCFIDFDEIDFDQVAVVTPASINGIMWQKFLSVALDGMQERLEPEYLVMCEGDINGVKKRNFDSAIYSKIFEKKYPQISFISGGSCGEIENPENVTFKILSSVMKSCKLSRLVDRDNKSSEEVSDLRKSNIYVTSRRHIESYLFDDELIERLVLEFGREDQIDIAKDIKNKEVAASVARGNDSDDIKSAAGQIYVELKKIIDLTRRGNNVNSFMIDTMCKYITEDTEVFKELEREVIEPILNGA